MNKLQSVVFFAAIFAPVAIVLVSRLIARVSSSGGMYFMGIAFGVYAIIVVIVVFSIRW